MRVWNRRYLRTLGGVMACGMLTGGSPARAAMPETPAARQAAAAAMPKGFLLKTIKQGDEEYRYVVYVPANYDDSKPWLSRHGLLPSWFVDMRTAVTVIVALILGVALWRL